MKTGVTTPLKRARGLGSAHDGTHHFIHLRLTSLALIPLSLWLVYSLLSLATAPDPTILKQWLANDWHALVLAITLVVAFYHSALGLQVVIEDYVHTPFSKITLLLINMFGSFAFALISIMAIVKLHYGVAG